MVRWLGAVQSQEFQGALWALALRLPETVESAVETAFTSGDILRTHVMRPTWHFVTPEDIRWMQALTASRVHALSAYYYRQVELDEALLIRCGEVIGKALEGGKQLTRAELAASLAEAGIPAEGTRLAYIVMYAELEAIICSGARRGKQFTYMLLDERAPDTKTMEQDAALAELTRRYFTSHGLATAQDFGWWSGLTQADVKAGLEMVQPDIVSEIIDGKMYWYSSSMPPVPESVLTAHLLPTYDEYVIGYTDRSGLIDASESEQQNLGRNLVFDSLMVIGGKVVGSWRRTFRKGAVVIELAPFRPLTAAEDQAVADAARRYGQFVEMPVVIEAPSRSQPSTRRGLL